MARDLNEAWGWIQRLVARVSRLESGAMLENSSITNGRMRFIGGLLRVDSGGRVEIVGTLNADGTITFTGPFNGTGTLTWTGPVNLKGSTIIDGLTTLLKTLTVKAGGKIVVEGAQSIELSSAAGTATLQFSDGPRLWSNGAAARMDSGPGTASVVATSTGAILRSPNTSNAVAASDTGTLVTGPLTASSTSVNLTGLQVKAGAVANLHVDAAGKLWKTS